MTESEFLAGLTGSADDLPRVAAALRQGGHAFCLIGGLAVNHYAEPLVTLDADFALATVGDAPATLRAAGFTVEAFPHSLNAQLPGSRLRIQITTDPRYTGFPARAVDAVVLGTRLPVACLEDVLQGKLWAAQDPRRRASKRQKDRLDITRLCEIHPHLLPRVPHGLVPEVDALRG